jgi:hypothetical protein
MKLHIGGALLGVSVIALLVGNSFLRGNQAKDASAGPPSPASQAWGRSPFDPGPTALPASRPVVVAQSAAVNQPATAPTMQPPPGVSAEQWLQLQQALRHDPQRQGELARIADYLAFSNRMERFNSLRAERIPSPELAPLAHQLDRELDLHIDRKELNAGEALLLKSALLSVIEANPERRSTALQAWRAHRAPMSASLDDPRHTAFLQKQASLVAQWQAQPEAQRDPAQLQSQLEQLRLASFGQERP